MNFDLIQARDIPEAVGMLERHGDAARILAGGTELLVNIKHHAISPEILIDIKPIHSLSYVKYDENGVLRVGALTPLGMIERSSGVRNRHPLISECIRSIATFQIRNVGTIGGNLCQTVKCAYYNQSNVNLFMRQSLEPCRQKGGSICHAARVDTLNHAICGKPVKGCIATTASDLATPLIALDAYVQSIGSKGERSIPARDFFRGGGRTALRKGEIAKEIQIPSASGTTSSYQKYSQGTRNFSILNGAVVARLTSNKEFCNDMTIILGGVSVVPLRLDSVETQFRSREISSFDLDVEGPLRRDLSGLTMKGDLSRYKLERAKTMVFDLIHSLLE